MQGCLKKWYQTSIGPRNMFKGNKKRERTLPGSVLLLSFYFAISPPVEKLTTCLSARRLAPLTLSWLSYYDIPCGECVRSGCSDCCAVTAGAVTEGLRGPSSSDTCCDNMSSVSAHSVSAQVQQTLAAHSRANMRSVGHEDFVHNTFDPTAE